MNKAERTIKEAELFNLINKHDGWEELISTLSANQLDNLIDYFKDYNKRMEE